MNVAQVLRIARREWLEQRRQPAMLGVIAALYALVSGIVVGTVGLLQVAAWAGSQDAIAALLGPGITGEAALTTLVGVVVHGNAYLLFSQFLGIAAVQAGHAVLHDRQCGTLTFLLLAPVSRLELVTGKVLGAVGPSWALYTAIGGAGSVAVALLPITAPHAALLPTSPSWWVAFLVGAPAWTLAVATLCTVISARARDVRTAQQGVWFLVFFATLGTGFLLTQALLAGLVAQLAVAAAAFAALVAALWLGASVVSADVSR